MLNKRQVNLHTEGVPNPNAIKIVLDNGILSDEPYEFCSLADAAHSPLAQKLLMLRYVERVMLNRNYVTIVKTAKGGPAWDDVLFELRAIIQQHLENDEPILYIGGDKVNHTRSDEIIATMAVELLDKFVRPAAQEDGGDILFDAYAGGVLTLRMHGACYKCPYINQTIKEGVEKMMMQFIPEIREVKPVFSK